jgi:CheY-like chemotaxis protein
LNRPEKDTSTLWRECTSALDGSDAFTTNNASKYPHLQRNLLSKLADEAIEQLFDVEKSCQATTICATVHPRRPRRLLPARRTGITSLEENRGSETILLVEDEEPLRHIVIDLLTQLGYRVLGASCGEEALALAEKHSGKIDVLVTDVLLPELNGPELANALRGICPGMKVIFVSGGVDSDSALTPGATLLMKPFTVKMLSAKVREVLGA